MQKIAAVLVLLKIIRAALPHTKEVMKKYKIISTVILILALIGLILVLITGCSTIDKPLNPEKTYRRDIKLEINGVDYDGVAVPKKVDRYKIKLKAVGKIDLLTVRSCHREEVFHKPKDGFFSSGKKFEYEYRPIAGIEDGRSCTLDIGAFEEKRGRHSFATIDFEHGEENLPALIKCDGKQWNTDPISVSICQARVGSLQKIIFDHRVKVSPDIGCQVMETKDEMTYTFQIAGGECVYYFVDKYRNIHKLTTIGYDELLIRNED